MSAVRKEPCKAFRPGLWTYNSLKFKKFWWDGWPPNSQSKCVFCQEFDFRGSADARTAAPSSVGCDRTSLDINPVAKSPKSTHSHSGLAQPYKKQSDDDHAKHKGVQAPCASVEIHLFARLYRSEKLLLDCRVCRRLRPHHQKINISARSRSS
jgi:hypothetical protein